MSVLKGGTLFAGRYVVVGHLASGGMGAVYEVTHTETDRRCALKVMQPHIMDEDGLRQRFKLEAKVAAQIDSDAVVQVFDAGVDAATGSPFLVMELLKGEDLAARVARLGRLSAKEVVSLLWQIAVALDKIHGAGVVHRDLKPENLFVVMRKDGKPQLKILDFGIAKAHVETASQQQGTLSIGTPMYMAPEQFDGKAVSGQTDTFSLALVAFTLLVGQPYWMEEASSAGVIAFAIKASSGLVEPACSRAARVGVELPAAFDAWFAKATARAARAILQRERDGHGARAGARGRPRDAAGLRRGDQPSRQQRHHPDRRRGPTHRGLGG
ncbi:MAG: serine/threonine-protein kinase [Polyangiaceae bacterium]